MKQLSLLVAALTSIAFLHIPASTAQQTNIFLSGVKYVGEMKDGKPNGHGTETWPGSTIYVGEFKDGKFDGKGVLRGGTCIPKGDPNNISMETYDGEFHNGEPNGLGTAVFQN